MASHAGHLPSLRRWKSLFLCGNIIRTTSCSSCRALSLGATVNSRYSKDYVDPTFRKEDLVDPLDEADKRRYQPIKAATPEQTSSILYDPLIAKFIRVITREGNKERARYILDRTLENIKLMQLKKWHKSDPELRDTVEINPRTVFHQAVDNCRPLLITQDVRRGGVVYKVPIPVKTNYQTYKAIRWLIESAEDKERNIRIWNRLAQEVLNAASNEQTPFQQEEMVKVVQFYGTFQSSTPDFKMGTTEKGKSIRKKQELHRICEANRAYAHFRW